MDTQSPTMRTPWYDLSPEEYVAAVNKQLAIGATSLKLTAQSHHRSYLAVETGHTIVLDFPLETHCAELLEDAALMQLMFDDFADRRLQARVKVIKRRRRSLWLRKCLSRVSALLPRL
jgi:hypothetical protein